MIQVPDAASIATMRLVRERTGRSVGGSTGTNVWGAFALVAEMLSRGQQGSVVTLICDGGDRYAGTYYSDAWVRDQGFELAPYRAALDTFLEAGGTHFGYLPCLNDSPPGMAMLERLIRRELAGWLEPS